jgi:predicted dehydrogenase
MEVKSKIKVGVVGVGHLGKFHVEKYSRMPEVELVGAADIQPERLEGLVQKYHLQGFSDYRDLIPRIEAASIVVPTSLHAAIARDFLEHGIHVLVEKPITELVSEAEELIALARSHDCLLQVGHLERFNPAFLEIKPLIQNPLFIESHRLGPFKERGSDVDVILDLMIHDLDLLLSLIQAPVKQVQAVGIPVISPQVDIANVRIQFENGAVANITASRISFKEMRKMRIFQPGGYISLDLGTKSYVTVRLEHPGPGANATPQFVAQEGKKETGDALEMELRAFIQAIRCREKPIVCGEEGKKALALAHWIKKEIRNHLEEAKQSAGAPGFISEFLDT